MVSDLAAEIVENSKIEGLITPFYEKLSILNVSSSILSFFEVRPEHSALPVALSEFADSNKLVVLLVDALGYNQLNFFMEKNDAKPLRELAEKGTFSVLTSTFPSTTTTAHATLHTGLSPQEHGLMGLFLFLKELRVVADMIEFKPVGETRRDMIFDMGFNPEQFFPAETIFEKLRQKQVSSCVVMRRSFIKSGLSTLFFRDVEFVPYVSLSDMFVLLRKTVERNLGERTYVFAYWPLLDAVSHLSGPYSEEARAEIRLFCRSLKEEFLEKLSPRAAQETVLMLTADHGQAAISREKAVNMKKHPCLLRNLTIPFAGDPRAAYLYIKHNKIHRVKEYFPKHFHDSFNVLESSRAFDMGLFGLGKAKKEAEDRIGDVIVVSRDESTIYYPYSQEEKEFSYAGFHGSLTEDEMLIPFFCVKMKGIV